MTSICFSAVIINASTNSNIFKVNLTYIIHISGLSQKLEKHGILQLRLKNLKF